MALQFETPITTSQADQWGEARETHPAVAMAIHALADSKRTAQAIWEEPTGAEFDAVAMAVENYVNNGIFPAEDDKRYPWGAEAIKL